MNKKAEIPDFWPLTYQWTDRRLTTVDHHQFARNVEIPASVAEHQKRRAEIVERVRFAVGLDILPPFSGKAPRVFQKEVYHGVVLQAVEIETYPGLRLTGTLYLPEKTEGKLPALICPHGHWTGGRVHHNWRGGVVMRCFEFARLGFAVFSYDMIGYNDHNDLPHQFPAEFKRRADLYGISPFALQTVNSLRALDFLESLPEVDAGKMGCTGASGGGSQTWFISILDNRIKALAPVCMLSAHFQGGCGCEEGSLLRLGGLGNFEILSCVAPRPVMLPSVMRDWTNLNPYYEIPKLKEIYKLYGAEDKVFHFHRDQEHNYDRITRESVYSFFRRELKGEDCPDTTPEREIDPPAPEMLWHGGVKPAPADDAKAADTIKKLESIYSGAPDLDRLRQIILPQEVQHVAERVTIGKWQIPGGIAQMRIVSRRDVGDTITAVKVFPEKTADQDTAVFLLAPGSFREFFDGKFAELQKMITDKGITSWIGELLGTGETAPMLDLPVRNWDDPQDLTFNPSLFAMRVQDILTQIVRLKEDGFRKVLLVSTAKTTPVAMAAAALSNVELLADLSGVDDTVWQNRLNYQPHIMKIGGIAGLRQLCSHARFCSGITELQAALEEI